MQEKEAEVHAPGNTFRFAFKNQVPLFYGQLSLASGERDKNFILAIRKAHPGVL
jgi:hypothetical protein